tara:strand:- start:579 stop:1034 length:456 start_codon:yes stop_codon:yes gene_type:complete
LKGTTIVLDRRLKTKTANQSLVLLLTAAERTRLRGQRQTTCGRNVLLQLPRQGVLMDGDLLAGKNPTIQVLVKAALEDLLVVSASSTLELTKAAYHLGNRHVDIELTPKELFLLDDPVLADLLTRRRLTVNKIKRTFSPEQGAYSINHHHD